MYEYKLIYSSDPKKFESDINDFCFLLDWHNYEVIDFKTDKDKDDVFYAHIFFKPQIIKNIVHQQFLLAQRKKRIKEHPEHPEKAQRILEYFKEQEEKIPC